MPRGGKRPGAGRPKGAISKSTRAIREAAENGGETPLEYMLRVMRDRKAVDSRRDEMAKAAAPYLHAKLSAIEHTGPQGGPVRFVIEAPPKAGSAEEWASRHKP